MRHLFVLAGLIIGAASAPAQAADLTPLVKAPVAYPTHYYNWSGFYLGVNGGGDWSHTEETSTITGTGITVASGSTNRAGGIGGFQAGVNWQFNPYVVAGFEGDFDFASNSGSVLAPDGAVRFDSNLKYISTGRARFGAVFDNWLLYVTGGVAWTQGNVTRTQLTSTFFQATPGTVESTSNARVGFAVGTGVEVGLAPSWTVKAEYLYLGMGTVNDTFPRAIVTTTQHLSINLVRVGLNYKFDWWTPPGY